MRRFLSTVVQKPELKVIFRIFTQLRVIIIDLDSILFQLFDQTFRGI